MTARRSPWASAGVAAIGVPDPDDLRRVVRTALAEDLRYGPDATTAATVPADAVAVGAFAPRAGGVLAGVPAVARRCCDEVLGRRGRGASTARRRRRPAAPPASPPSSSGPRCAGCSPPSAPRSTCSATSPASPPPPRPGSTRWPAPARASATPARPCPGLRLLEKYAVRCGGGVNHRLGLGDAVLIKDNHVAAAGSVGAALRRGPGRGAGPAVRGGGRLARPARRGAGAGRGAGAARQLHRRADARRRSGGGASAPTLLESSGGLALANARAYAETGVDFLAVGALTHSVTALDVGLDLQES